MGLINTSDSVHFTRSSDLTDLPNEVLDIIALFLQPEDVIRCRLVSQRWLSAFTKPDLSKHVLQAFFPRAREVRLANDRSDWTAILTAVLGRYHFLQKGAACYSEKLPIQQAFVEPGWARFYPISTWQHELYFESRVAEFHYPDTLWAYDDGLLVFPSAKTQKYQLYDIAVGSYSDVNFEIENKRYIRRMRLCERTLVVEWAEVECVELMNGVGGTQNHRHFVTVYDILPVHQTGWLRKEGIESTRDDCRNSGWITQFRCELKIGAFPLDSKHRFYSTHNTQNYALYSWEPNNSLGDIGHPFESLSIWDISTPHPYRPSLDYTSKHRPLIPSSGARLLKCLKYRDLRFHGLLQNLQPRFRELVLDAGHVYVIEEDHRWMVGSETGRLPRLHRLKTTGIPFASGPAWVDECGADGDVHLSFCQRTTQQRQVGAPPCWRHEDFPYLTVSEVFDEAAGVRFSARRCFMMKSLSLTTPPHTGVTGTSDPLIGLPVGYWKEIMQKGKICGDERWIVGENESNEIVILYFDWVVGQKRQMDQENGKIMREKVEKDS